MEQIPNIIQISEQTDLMQARIRLCNRFPYVIKVKAFNTVATKKKEKEGLWWEEEWRGGWEKINWYKSQGNIR